MALIYADEAAWEGLDEAARSDAMARYVALARDAREAKVFAAGEELATSRDATTVRLRDGDTVVSDGPYAEVKEALGGYFVFECETMDEALGWAARIPAAEHGAVEVRPVHHDEEEAA
jgi:hypothetical protein